MLKTSPSASPGNRKGKAGALGKVSASPGPNGDLAEPWETRLRPS